MPPHPAKKSGKREPKPGARARAVPGDLLHQLADVESTGHELTSKHITALDVLQNVMRENQELKARILDLEKGRVPKEALVTMGRGTPASRQDAATLSGLMKENEAQSRKAQAAVESAERANAEVMRLKDRLARLERSASEELLNSLASKEAMWVGRLTQARAAHEAELTRIRSETDKGDEERLRALRQVDLIAKQFDSIAAENKALLDTVESLRRDLKDVSQSSEQLSENHTRVLQRNHDLVRQVGELEAVRDQLRELEVLFERAQMRIEGLQRRNDGMSSELDELRALQGNAKAREEREKRRRRRNETVDEELQGELDALRLQLEASREETIAARRDGEATKADLRKVKSLHQQAVSDLSQFRLNSTGVSSRLESLTREVTRLRQVETRLRGENDMLRQRQVVEGDDAGARSVFVQLTASKREVKALRGRIEQLTQQLSRCVCNEGQAAVGGAATRRKPAAGRVRRVKR